MEGDTKRIEGIVEEVRYINHTNGYVVLDLNCNDELVTAVGELGEIENGESLILEGFFTTHKIFGEQFKAEYCERKLPESEVSIEKFLSDGSIKGIGKALAKRIVQQFGKDTLFVIENEPERLTLVKGISPKKCREITAEAKKIFALRQLTSFLAKYNIRPQTAMKAYKEYGTDALESIKENPYILCEEPVETDFQKADTIAHDMNIERNSEKRITAGLQYILKANALLGHTCMPVEILSQKAESALSISEEEFYQIYSSATQNNKLFQFTKNKRDYAYLNEYFNAETYIAYKIHLLIDSPCQNFDCKELIKREEALNNIKYEKLQCKAIETALNSNVSILTGGPGTGKTTALNAVISILEKMGFNVMLTAPTGRASKRMSDLTGYEAKTIHRLLECKYDGTEKHRFMKNKQSPLECTALIVDEMSMVDALLFESLISAVTSKCKLILVGDSDQLPSVGAGNVLRDLIESGTVPVTELKEVFRQSSQSCIITNAHKIVSGNYPELTRKDNDFFFFKRNNPEQIQSLISDLAKTRLPKAYGYSPYDDIQIISPTKQGATGTAELNRILQSVLNPPSPMKAEFKSVACTFRSGDKVMQTKNNYDIEWKKGNETGSGIFNGDIGIIKSMNKNGMTASIDFDGRIAVYSFDLMSQLDLAYAITVHKSQGCEFEAVIMPVFSVFSKLSYRNLLYTAVTRAKKLLILIGSEYDIYCMVDNDKRTNRYTCLDSMIRKTFGIKEKEDTEITIKFADV